MTPKTLAVLLSLVIGLGAAAVHATTHTGPAATELAPLTALSPLPRESLIDQAIAGILTRYHYGKARLDTALSQKIFHSYLEGLDPNRSYFLESDIRSFAPYRDTLDDAIRNGDLKPAFAIYNVYQKRVEQRIRYALRLLEHEPDFTVEQSYTYDRSKAPWATSATQLDDIWRQRVKNDAIGLLLAGKTWKETAAILSKRYQNFEYRAHQIAPNDVFNLFMNAYTLSLDPHTNYFSPDQSEEFQIQMSLKLQGIGAALTSEGEYTKIASIIPGGPAALSKELHPDDRITGVAQGDKGAITDVVGWRLDDVVQLIRGPKGSVVRLQILPAGAPPGSAEKVIRLVRATVKLEAQHAHKSVLDIEQGKQRYKIGVITIPSFYSDFEGRMEGEKNYTSTTRDVRKLLLDLEAEKVSGVVIDLRNNGGGALDEATKLTGLFIPRGPVVQIRHQNGDVEIDTDDHSGIVYRGPLVVLVNRFTASASEIFAAAIQDYHRGLIVGSTTYGKGTVQTLFDLNRILPGNQDAGQLKFTIDKFYRVNGASTQLKGVTPDIEMPSSISSKEFGEDTQADALPWDQIAPTSYTPLHLRLEAALPKLRDLYAERTAHNPGWALYLDSIKMLAAERSEKSISLVLSTRKEQRKRRDQERLVIANGWRRFKGLPPATTLEAAIKLPATGTQGGAPAAASRASDAGSDSDVLTTDELLMQAAHIALDMATLHVGYLPITTAQPGTTATTTRAQAPTWH
ncbi:MAG: carboxy terminal-processing peptidase [Gammaproteobacteria bacterium]